MVTWAPSPSAIRAAWVPCYPAYIWKKRYPFLGNTKSQFLGGPPDPPSCLVRKWAPICTAIRPATSPWAPREAIVHQGHARFRRLHQLSWFATTASGTRSSSHVRMWRARGSRRKPYSSARVFWLDHHLSGPSFCSSRNDGCPLLRVIFHPQSQKPFGICFPPKRDDLSSPSLCTPAGVKLTRFSLFLIFRNSKLSILFLLRFSVKGHWCEMALWTQWPFHSLSDCLIDLIV